MNKFLKSISNDKTSLTMFIMWLVIFIYDCYMFNRIDIQKEFNFGYVGSGYLLALFLAMILAFFQMLIIGVLFMIIQFFVMDLIKAIKSKNKFDIFLQIIGGLAFLFFYGYLIFLFFDTFMFIGYFTK